MNTKNKKVISSLVVTAIVSTTVAMNVEASSISSLEEASKRKVDRIVATIENNERTEEIIKVNNEIEMDKANQQVIEINNIDDLKNINNNLAGSYKLAKNINLNSEEVKIGSKDNPFTGTFDGSNYTISNLKSAGGVEIGNGLFVSTKGATIKNLNLKAPNVDGHYYTGALVGIAYDTKIQSVKVEDPKVNCDGITTGVSLLDSTSTYAGGVVGWAEDTIINQVQVIRPSITNTTPTAIDGLKYPVYYSGGITGINKGGSIFYAQVLEGSVKASHQSTVGLISVTKLVAGGITGRAAGAIENVYSTSNVDTYGRLDIPLGGVEPTSGGIAGYYADGASIKSAVFKGIVNTETRYMGIGTHDKWTGGIVGWQEGGDLADIQGAYYHKELSTPNDSWKQFGAVWDKSNTEQYGPINDENFGDKSLFLGFEFGKYWHVDEETNHVLYGPGENEENANVNIDTDGDGTPDVNVDTDGDGTPDINIDTDEDGVPDVNVDTTGDGKADVNIDTDGDGVADTNVVTPPTEWNPGVDVDTDGDGTPNYDTDTNYPKPEEKPNVNIDTDGDGTPDVNVDTDGDGTPDINIDTDEDGVPDVNVDTTGDGQADVNIDTDGDGVADTNVVTPPTEWNPGVDVDTDGDGTPNYDTDTNYPKPEEKPNVNIDTDGDGTPDVNVDTDGDGTPDINIDTDGDGVPDVNVDTTGDGQADVNIDTDGDGVADTNVVTPPTEWNPGVDVDTDGDGTPNYDTDTNYPKPEEKPEVGEGKTYVKAAYWKNDAMLIDGYHQIEGLSLDNEDGKTVKRRINIIDENGNIVSTSSARSVNWETESYKNDLTGFQVKLTQDEFGKLEQGKSYKLELETEYDGEIYKLPLTEAPTMISFARSSDWIDGYHKTFEALGTHIISGMTINASLDADKNLIVTREADNNVEISITSSRINKNNELVIDGSISSSFDFNKKHDKYIVVKDSEGNEVFKKKATAFKDNKQSFQAIIPEEFVGENFTYEMQVNTNDIVIFSSAIK